MMKEVVNEERTVRCYVDNSLSIRDIRVIRGSYFISVSRFNSARVPESKETITMSFVIARVRLLDLSPII